MTSNHNSINKGKTETMKRPEGMDFEDYKKLRKSNNKILKDSLKPKKVWESKIYSGNAFMGYIGQTYRTGMKLLNGKNSLSRKSVLINNP